MDRNASEVSFGSAGGLRVARRVSSVHSPRRRRRRTFVLPEASPPGSVPLSAPSPGALRSRNVSLGGVSVTSIGDSSELSRIAEVHPTLRQFFVYGLLVQLFWPLMAAFTVLRKRTFSLLFFPLGTWWYCAPVMWALSMVCLVSIFMMPASAHATPYLRDSTARREDDPMSVGCGVIALAFYVVVAVAAAGSMSHNVGTRDVQAPIQPTSPATAAVQVPLRQQQHRVGGAGGAVSILNVGPVDDDDGQQQDEGEEIPAIEFIPAHTAYDLVLFDEAPPLPSWSCLHFVYRGREWFRFNRAFEGDLLPSATSSSGGSSSNSGVGDGDADSSFLFRCGEILVRNSNELEREINFEGEVGKVEFQDAIEVCDRIWRDDGVPLYAAEGGRAGLFLPIEGLFDIETQSVAHSNDIMVGSEAILHALSRRKRLQRVHLGSGVFASSKRPAPMHLVERLLFLLLSGVFACLPMLIRLLKRQPILLKAEGNDVQIKVVAILMPVSAVLLCFLSTITLCTVLRATGWSIANAHDTISAFNKVTLGARPNRWFPLLNPLETLNIQAWHVLSSHLKFVHSTSLSMRVLLSCWVGVCGTIAAAVCTIYFLTLRFVSISGVGLQLVVFAAVAGSVSCKHFFVSSEINDAAHTDQLAVVSLYKVSLDEELFHSSGRKSADVSLLSRIRALLADIAFALEHAAMPIEPGGLALRPWFFRIALLLQLLVVLPVAAIVIGFFVNNEEWKTAVYP